MTVIAQHEGSPARVRGVLDRGVAISEAIVVNARLARQYWAVWEALNNRLEPGRPLPQALAWHAPAGLGIVRRALAESTIMSVLRVSEGPKSDRLSACLLSGLLGNEAVADILVSEEWIRRGSDVLPEIIRIELEEQPRRIEWFKANVPCGWGRGYAPPSEGNLKETRDSLREVRDTWIAHSLDREIDRPSYDKIREALRVASEIAEQASLIFLGHTSGLDADPTDSVRLFDQVWELFERGLVSSHEQWLNEYRKLGSPPQ